MPKIDEDRTRGDDYTALGVHIFAGGFTVGVRRAGFRVLAHLEDTKYGTATAAKNLKVPIRVGFDEWRLDEYEGRVDFMYSNPPCAIFSSAGIVTTRGEGAWRDDPRLGCWERAWEARRVVRPTVLAIESVCQAYTRGRELIDRFTREAVSDGMHVDHVFMDAKYVGLPQTRRRFFIVVYDEKLSIDYEDGYGESRLTTVAATLRAMRGPASPGDSTHTDKTGGANFARWISKTKPGHQLREAFDDEYSEFTGKNCAEEDMAATPPGGYVRKTFDRKNPGKKKGRPGFMHRRLPLDDQMGAFVGDVFAHPVENRYLTAGEMKALCGYPSDWWLEGAHGGRASLLARAVLPPVGEWMARSVARALGSTSRSRRSARVRLVDLRKLPATIVDLTEKYS